jgi:Glycogen recognition site of AMP-activated protein kinase
MSADHDDELHDELLRRVVAELRRPVRLDPAVDVQALRAIREETRPAPSRRRLWLGAAALAAGLLVAVLLRQPSSDRAVVATQAAGAGETRQVELRLSAPASSVTVVGDFNDWDPSGTPLRPTGRSDVWSVELRLKPGRYHYTFLIDGRRWAGDPSEPRVTKSDFGAPVSVLTVS